MKPNWNPGAWTPDRCALWREFEAQGRPDLMKRLEDWVWAEHERKACFKDQLPTVKEQAA